MTMNARFVLHLAAIVAAICSAGPAFGQGTLTPPGAPTPTMQTLDQLGAKLDALTPRTEARTIVNTANTPGDASNTFIISQPGSYFLTANVTGDPGKNGISIQADNVTLDLNGFALMSGGGGNFRGVNVPSAQTNFCIRNGSVSGWTDGGVRAEAAVTLAEKLMLSNNVGATGLTVGNGSLVKDCVATNNSSGFVLSDRTHIINCIATLNSYRGFDCTSYITIVDCTASRNSGSGISVGDSSTIVRCNSSRNSLAGIQAVSGCTIANCTTGSNDYGIFTDFGCTVQNCTAQANLVVGIQVSDRCYVLGNACNGNATGIQAQIGNRIDGNSTSSSTVRAYSPLARNIVIRNTSNNDQNPFGGFNENAYGPIEILIIIGSSGRITEPSPWANFVY